MQMIADTLEFEETAELGAESHGDVRVNVFSH